MQLDQTQIVYDKYKQQILQSVNLVQLRSNRETFQTFLQAEFQHNDLPMIQLLNQVFDLLIRQVVVFTEKEVNQRYGLQTPPVPYAFLLFGSAGRKEQMIGSDQDNGLIYASTDDEQLALLADQYFSEFATVMTDYLVQLGFAECSGRVICSEARWRKTDKQWYSQMLSWMHDPTFEHVRVLLVLADARTIYGEKSFLEQLHQKFHQFVYENPQILASMLRNTLHRKVLIGIFGNLIREQFGEAQGGIDVKYGAYVPFVNSIRLLSIRHEIRSSSTLERIDKLCEKGVVDSAYGNQLKAAFTTILFLRAHTYIKDDEKLFVSDGKLKSSQLTSDMIAALKSSMNVAKHLQKFVQKTIERETGGSSLWT